MSDFGSLEGTSAWLRGQLQNPGDIFNLLLLIGGDVLRTAIAQLSAGPVPYLTPVSFSFGWVSAGPFSRNIRKDCVLTVVGYIRHLLNALCSG